MTDNEILKALECCSNKEVHFCTLCPMFMQDKENDFCQEDLAKKALVLINRLKGESNKYRHKVQMQKAEIARLHKEINRQKAEIEKLKAENEVMKTNCNSMCVSMPNMAKAERAEAIKEFAERLKEKGVLIEVINKRVVTVGMIDNLAREMTEQ